MYEKESCKNCGKWDKETSWRGYCHDTMNSDDYTHPNDWCENHREKPE